MRVSTVYATFSTIVAANLWLSVSAIGSPSKNVHSGVYALPEITIKFQNGTIYQTEPNSPVVLSQELASVELTCTADYPIKWEYRVKNKTLPVLDVMYRRLTRNISSDFDNSQRDRFMSLITIRGLMESQTGKYLCRHYNDKLDNNNYNIASYFDIFIPGNRTFNTVSNIKFINQTHNIRHVDIHCPVTDPSLHVRLFRFNEKHFNKTGQVFWKPIYSNYEPTDGFRLLAGLGRELLGIYNCTAENGASVISIIADISEQELYHTSSSSVSANPCWENFKLVQYIRSQRLECYCKDSYGLFMNDNYEFENRQASCSQDNVWNHFKNCSDWRLEEFFGNGEESLNSCFRQPIHADGSGSRPSLIVNGKTFSDGDSLHSYPFTKLNITYNGFMDWAGDFTLAIARKQTSSKLEYFENEAAHTKYFPLAYYQAVWKDIFVNDTDIAYVYVFQADSLSYARFPFASENIEWSDINGGMAGTSDDSAMSSGSSTSVLISNYFVYILTIMFVIQCSMFNFLITSRFCRLNS